MLFLYRLDKINPTQSSGIYSMGAMGNIKWGMNVNERNIKQRS